MRIAVVAGGDPRDRRIFSGTTRSILDALTEEIGQVETAFPRRHRAVDFASKVSRKITAQRYDLRHLSWLEDALANDALGQLRAKRIDLAIVVAASALAARLGRHFPTVHISDTTFALMRDFYPSFRAMSEVQARHAEANERAAIANAALVSVSSPWAARSVIGEYGKPKERVLTAPWGCNFAPVARQQVKSQVDDDKLCRLLFVGLDWQRKGGDIVLETAKILDREGFPFRVDFAGAAPAQMPDMEQLQFHGVLRKGDIQQERQLMSLFREASFLFLPTRQDCTPMVFAEANAYGVPAISADVGGVSGVVQHGINGLLLPAEAKACDFAEAIIQAWRDRTSYLALRKGARKAYETEFNWGIWAKRFRQAIEVLPELTHTRPEQPMRQANE